VLLLTWFIQPARGFRLRIVLFQPQIVHRLAEASA